MKKRCFAILLTAILLCAVLVGCKREPPLTLAPLQEPEELSQVLSTYNAVLNEAEMNEASDLGWMTYTDMIFGENCVFGHPASVLFDKLQELELEPDQGDAIPEGEGYPIVFRYRLGQIKLGVMNEEQIDIYYYNTPEDNGVPRYQLKILNREVGEELCEIAENFREWEKALSEKSKTD